ERAIPFQLQVTSLAAKEVAKAHPPGTPLWRAVLPPGIGAGHNHVPGPVEDDIRRLRHGVSPVQERCQAGTDAVSARATSGRYPETRYVSAPFGATSTVGSRSHRLTAIPSP